MSESRANTLLAIGLGLLIALGAHESGKPWWVDHPFMGDATDVGTFTGLLIRWLLWMFEKRSAR